jgi:hypothetical protein
MAVLPTNSIVQIISVTVVTQRERLLMRRALLGTGVSVDYTVELDNPPQGVTASSVTTTLQSPASVATVTQNLQTTFPSAAVQTPVVTDISPTSSPTMAPTVPPFVGSNSKSSAPRTRSSVVGVGIISSLCVVISSFSFL